MTTRQLRLEDVVQTYSSDNVSDIEHLLDDKRDLWPGFLTKLVLKSTLGRRLRRRSLRYAQCCPHRRRKRGKRWIWQKGRQPGFLRSWTGEFRSWWQNLLPWRSSEGKRKQRRNFVGEFGGATCTTSCLLTHHSLCHVNVQRGTVTWAFCFSFPGYLEWQRPFRAKLSVKKELVERNSLDLAPGVRGCTKGVQRSIEKWLQHSDESLSLSLSLSLFFSSVSLLFFSWTKSYASIYFSLAVFFYFFVTCSHLKDWRTSWFLALFPPRSWISMQLAEIAQMDSLHVFF